MERSVAQHLLRDGALAGEGGLDVCLTNLAGDICLLDDTSLIGDTCLTDDTSFTGDLCLTTGVREVASVMVSQLALRCAGSRLTERLVAGT